MRLASSRFERALSLINSRKAVASSLAAAPVVGPTSCRDATEDSLFSCAHELFRVGIVRA